MQGVFQNLEFGIFASCVTVEQLPDSVNQFFPLHSPAKIPVDDLQTGKVWWEEGFLR